jgi:hypothetical protein
MRTGGGEKIDRKQKFGEKGRLHRAVPDEKDPQNRRYDRENDSENRQNAPAPGFKIRAVGQTQNARHRHGERRQQDLRFQIAEIAEKNYKNADNRAEGDRSDQQIKKKFFKIQSLHPTKIHELLQKIKIKIVYCFAA